MKKTIIALLLFFATGLAAQPLTQQQLEKGNYLTLQAYLQPTDEGIPEVEEKPMYPGGEAGLMQDLGSHIKYPKKARKKGITGSVVIGLVIEKDGNIGEVTVKKSVDPELDAAAVAAVKQLQRFYPGKAGGSFIRVMYYLPIKFALE